MSPTQQDAARLVPPARAARLLGLVTATSGEVHEAVSPLDGSAVARVPQSTPADVDAAFARAREAQRAWGALTASERGRRLLAFHDLLLANQAELADLIIVETGKELKKSQ